MNREDIIRMARESGLGDTGVREGFIFFQPGTNGLERFAALVAAAERDARIEAQKRIEALQAENVSNEANRLAAVLNEREACAKVADGYVGADPIADAIRARGEKK